MQWCYVVLYINPPNHDPGVKNDPTLGIISSHILSIILFIKSANHAPPPPHTHTLGSIEAMTKGSHYLLYSYYYIHMKKISETARPKYCIFSKQQCYMVIYIDPDNDASKWPHPGRHACYFLQSPYNHSPNARLCD